MLLHSEVVNYNDTKVCLIDAFPPPVVGKSMVTVQVRKSLQDIGMPTFTINLSPGSLTRNWQYYLTRLSRVFIGIEKFFGYLCVTPNLTIYLAVSGGLGQLYDILFVTLARLFGKRIFLHHHSYAYIDEKHWTTNILLQIAGGETTHIVLCDDMRYKLSKLYKNPGKTITLSNVGILALHETLHVEGKKKLRTIGFLSNISFEKGISEFFDVVEQLEKKGHQLTAVIAGPFQNSDVESFVRQRIDTLSSVTYVGAKYGHEKKAFFDSIDVLLFPTKYVNEAEPLTIIETMSYGVPVIAWERGCIGDIVRSEAGLLIHRDKDFVHSAVKQIELWHERPSDYQKVSRSTREWFLSMRTLHSKNFNDFLQKMLLI